MALAVRNVFQADVASLAVNQAHYDFFPASACAVNLFCFLIQMHVASEAADKGFVGFDRAATAHFLKGAALHREADAVQHEPRGLLTDVQVACDFARANAVLAVADQPDSGQPLRQGQRRILEYRANLHAKLTPLMFPAALPATLIRKVVNLIRSASRTAHDAVRPAARNHVSDATIFVGKVADCIGQVLGRVAVRFHTSKSTGSDMVSQVYTCLN
jgi:hypothetical protein